MIEIRFEDVYLSEIGKDAILNNEFQGFKEDYLVLHCLLKMFQPKTVLEIGTNMGTGTQIIKNAVPEAIVYSLDLPTELAHSSLQHPISEGKGDNVGIRCKLPYIQLRGDSLTFDYSSLPKIDAWYIDGEHDFLHPNHEAKEAIKMNSRIIVFHDADILEVYEGIMDAFKDNKNYTLYRVVGTRIAYARNCNYSI